MTHLYDFLVECLTQLTDALDLVNFSVFSSDWSSMTYTRFLTIFLGGTVAFSALHWGWKKGAN